MARIKTSTHRRRRERKSMDKPPYAETSLQGSSLDKNKERFEVPFFLFCKGCYTMIAKGVNLTIGSKKVVGNYRSQEIWRYNIECPCCGYKIVMEGISGDSKYKLVKGAIENKSKKESGGASRVDFESLQKEHNLKYLDSIVPGSSVRFKVPFCLECQGCNSAFSTKVDFNGNKIPVGNYRGREIWRYIMECPCCGYKIVMERTSEDSKFDIIDGGMIYVRPELNDGTSLAYVEYVDPKSSLSDLAED